MSESGMFASSEAEMLVEPTGVDPTGVEPTGVEPTGVEPTGAEPSWPATSICSTVVVASAFRQLPPSFGMIPPGPHQALKPPASEPSGVLPIKRADQRTLFSSVVERSTCLRV